MKDDITLFAEQKAMRKKWLRRGKRRKRSVSWRTGRIREDSTGMARLRSQAFHRSQGICECGCKARVSWIDGHLHHVVSRARGGSDVLDNVLFITRACHQRIHGDLHWSPPNWLEALA